MRIHIDSIGLAAYIKMSGCALITVNNNNIFEFDSSKTIEEWNIMYINSCCSRHDSEICNLRRLTKHNRRP